MQRNNLDLEENLLIPDFFYTGSVLPLHVVCENWQLKKC